MFLKLSSLNVDIVTQASLNELCLTLQKLQGSLYLVRIKGCTLTIAFLYLKQKEFKNTSLYH